MFHIAEKRFQKVAEKVAGTAYDRCPEESTAEVKEHEAAGVEAAASDDDGGDGPHAVDKAKPKDGN